MRLKQWVAVGIVALSVLAGTVWQAYRAGYNAGKRETLFRFMTLADKDVTRSLATTPQEEQLQDKLRSSFQQHVQRLVFQVMRETGAPRATPADLDAMSGK